MALPTLHPRTAEVVDELERAQRELVDLVMSIPAAQHDASVEDGQWTIAQHLEHLAIVEDGAGRLMSKLIKQIEAAGDMESDESSVRHSLDQFQIWTVTKRYDAPEFVRPRDGLTASDALAKLTAARVRMIAALERSSGLALASVKYPHPVVGPLDVYQWGLITAQHQRRHAELIRAMAGLGDA